MARSLAIYHGIPGRQRRMKRLYARFLRPGDLAFDIGAHAGNRVRGLVGLGCRVVALEPQPDFARLLRALFGRSTEVSIVQSAVGRTAGKATLAISERTPTVSTIAAEWRARRAHEPDFSVVRWNRQLEVDVTTLDLLIQRFGMPAFIKIDVEGSESSVLAGLSRAVPGLSFEFLPRALGELGDSVAQLLRLGSYRFNWSSGESYELASERWLTEQELMAVLQTPRAQQRSGDVYARLER
jgi:FkbM family methyltransferase